MNSSSKASTSGDGGGHTISGTTTTGTAQDTAETGSSTALTFQQRAMPFVCVNYIIAT
jgi:hypothetical protein